MNYDDNDYDVNDFLTTPFDFLLVVSNCFCMSKYESLMKDTKLT